MSDRSLTANGATTWQSLDQLAGEHQHGGEFSTTATTIADANVSRRGFIGALSAAMAVTAAACRRPLQHLVPSVNSNQTAVPGLPVEYASVYTKGNIAFGALIKTREGRPIKVKGNALHPVNGNGTNSEMQASILSLYDPDRIRRPRVRRGGGATSYDNALTSIADAIKVAQEAGKRAVFVIDDHCSPSFAVLQQQITASLPAVSFVTMPAITCDNAAMANKAVLGIDAELVPDLAKAMVVVAVDADPLGTDPLEVYHSRQFATRRRPSKEVPAMSKLIVAEAQYSLTGANSDQRYRLHPSQLEPFIAVIEAEVCGSTATGADLVAMADSATRSAAQQAAVALKSAPQQSVLLAGRHLSPRAHVMALNVTYALGGVVPEGVVDPSRRIPNSGVKGEAIAQLQSDLESGNVHALIFCGVNPEYTASRSFRKAMLKAPFRAAINLYEDETAALCDVSIPAAHWLESWSDATTFDGTMSVQQPAIRPLNDGVEGLHDGLMRITRKLVPGFLSDNETYHDYIKANWATVIASVSTVEPTSWNTVLRDGVVRITPMPTVPMLNLAAAGLLPGSTVKAGARQLLVVPSLTLSDGTYSNNAWLMELPDPVTKITWDNVAMMSAATAIKLGLATASDPKALRKANGQLVTLHTEHGTIDAPAWVQPGMADDVVALSLGYGRKNVGQVANGVGVNAYAVANQHHTVGYVEVNKISLAGTSVRIACSQDHHTLDDGNGQRPVAKWLTLQAMASGQMEDLSAEYPSVGTEGAFRKPLSIVPEYTYKGHRWGMVIDMSTCTGCSSCVIACQSENNISVVGKDQVLIGREMHWIRLDRYYVGNIEAPETVMEPMLCQHCENAPCENVCPVAATTHSPEGLNEMTYNRCVGTRYCLNNCPYKVRRFNFLDYNDNLRTPTDLVFNPDITMRMRGVMEKCTFCVQRLHEAKWHARDQGRARVMDGEVVVACQEACPSGSIIFGDTNDPNSAVSKARMSERGFQVLAELNVRPQVTYLAKVRNA